MFAIIFSSTGHANDTPHSPQYQTHESLHQLVYQHLKQKADQKLVNPQITIKPISQRLKLGYCQSGVELFDKTPQKKAGRMSLRLSCEAPEWKLHISGKVEGSIEVVKTTRAILKKSIISSEDVTLALVPYKSVKKKTLFNLERVIGMRAKRSISANKIITLNYLLPPYLVFKDQPIKIVTKAGSIRVETDGVALKNGTHHQQVPVKNNNSERILKGIVIAPNTVWIP